MGAQWVLRPCGIFIARQAIALAKTGPSKGGGFILDGAIGVPDESRPAIVLEADVGDHRHNVPKMPASIGSPRSSHRKSSVTTGHDRRYA